MKEQKIKSVKELEEKLSVEKLEDRLEMVQVVIVAAKSTGAEAKGDCVCDNDVGGK